MRKNKYIDKFFRDSEGKIVIGQWPNIPLYGWGIFMILSRISFLSEYKSGFEVLSSAFLFTWAYLEITSGVNYFRKFLGVIILIFWLTTRF